MRTDYFDGLFDGLPPAPVTHVTHRQTDCVTTNPASITTKNSDLEESLRTLRTLRTEIDNSRKEASLSALTAGNEKAIRAWLTHIEETNPIEIQSVLSECRQDPSALLYYLGRAAEITR